MSEAVKSVPLLDLSKEFRELETEWLAAIREAGKTGTFVLGPNVTALEKEVAAYVGTKHAVAVANGTDALVLSLRAFNIGSGDEVITTAFTFIATAEAISIVGATPVFVDIDPVTFNIDPKTIPPRLSDKTRAIIPVHLYGYPAAMQEIVAIARENNLVVIEDCAQAFGASDGKQRVGSFGDTGCFSFYPTKVLGCYGDGGMVTTDSRDVAQHLIKLRNHGAVKPFVHGEIGNNSRLDEIHAALLRIKLRTIEQAIAARQRLADEYTRRLQGLGVTTPTQPAGGKHVFNLYTIRAGNRDRVRQKLTDQHIASALCYPVPLHFQDVYKSLGYKPGDLPICERAAAEVLSLPVYPDMPIAHIGRVCEVLKDAVQSG